MFTSHPPSMHQRRAQGDGGDGEEKRDEQSTMVACPAAVRRPSRRTGRRLLEGLAAVPGGHVTDSSVLVCVVVAEFPHTWRTNVLLYFCRPGEKLYKHSEATIR